MALMKYQNNFPSLFDRLFDYDLFDWANKHYSDTHTTLPSVNIKEGSDTFEVELAAPGFEKEDFKLELDNEILTICSEKNVENETKEGQQFTRREFSYQSFCRSFHLPNTVDSEGISAKYDKGVLHVVIPKKESAKEKPARKIDVL
jgi:HSP20 family protein